MDYEIHLLKIKNFKIKDSSTYELRIHNPGNLEKFKNNAGNFSTSTLGKLRKTSHFTISNVQAVKGMKFYITHYHKGNSSTFKKLYLEIVISNENSSSYKQYSCQILNKEEVIGRYFNSTVMQSMEKKIGLLSSHAGWETNTFKITKEISENLSQSDIDHFLIQPKGIVVEGKTIHINRKQVDLTRTDKKTIYLNDKPVHQFRNLYSLAEIYQKHIRDQAVQGSMWFDFHGLALKEGSILIGTYHASDELGIKFANKLNSIMKEIGSDLQFEQDSMYGRPEQQLKYIKQMGGYGFIVEIPRNYRVDEKYLNQIVAGFTKFLSGRFNS
ncbi:MAG: hypothetical protein ACXAD7_22080 [Candidatus Kariarchaeaceae archaeon]